MKYLVLLLLFGCSSISISELEDQLFACDAAGALGCEELRDEVEKRHEHMAERKADKNRCPKGMIEFKGMGDTACVSEQGMREIFSR